jgi:hypothetical protein
MIRRLAGLIGVLGVLLSTLVLMSGSPAFACSCVMADTASHISQADLVFTGKVVSADRDRQTVTYSVRADRVYKGTLTKADVSVNSNAQSTACGVDLPESKEAVFFATDGADGADGLSVSSCGGTTLATADLTAEITGVLGAGTPARDAVPIDHDMQRQSDNGPLYVAVGTGILALVAAVGLGVLYRRRRRA